VADAEQRARALARRITSIADPAVRVKYLAHEIQRMGPGDVATLVTLAMHGAEARDGDAGALLLALCLALAREECGELRERVVRSAAAAGQHETVSLLDPRPAERVTENDPQVPDFGRGRSLTLGERKSLARSRDRDLLARVLRDPHPDVIRILLGNPTLTETDVVRLCARRPIPEDVLREVFRCTRWIVRYRVRRSLVKNPFTPIDLALQLAAHLTAPDAREVVDSPELSLPVRDLCRRVARMGTVH